MCSSPHGPVEASGAQSITGVLGNCSFHFAQLCFTAAKRKTKPYTYTFQSDVHDDCETLWSQRSPEVNRTTTSLLPSFCWLQREIHVLQKRYFPPWNSEISSLMFYRLCLVSLKLQLSGTYITISCNTPKNFLYTVPRSHCHVAVCVP